MSLESSFHGKPTSKADYPPVELEDFIDRPEIYNALKRLSPELLARHLPVIDELPDEEAHEYVRNLIERREAAQKDFFISDKEFRTTAKGHEGEIQGALETSVFTDAERQIGEGQTAKVQRFAYQEGERPMAVKYLVNPRESTLDVAAEHNLLSEVDQLRRIEEAEARAGTTRIKVPHPYFYYRHGKIQCYAMEEVDGITLLKYREGEYPPELKEELRTAFADIDRAKLLKEIDRFFEVMHQICLHNDIYVNRPGNLMASRDGTFYIIDFGESIAANTIDEQFSGMYLQQKEKEVKAAKIEITKFLDALYA